MNVVVSHWSANAVVLAAYAVAAAAHLLGVRGAAAAARRRGDAPPAGQVREAVAFQGGLLAAALALVSPLGYWSHIYIWVRSVQDLLLALVAPGLIVLGAPWEALARVLAPARRLAPWLGRQSGSAAAAAADPLDQPARERPERGWRTVPVAVTAAYNLVWWGWHLPVLYDAAARQPVTAAAEVIMYLGGGILLWRQLIGSRTCAPAFSPLHRSMLVAATAASGTVLAMILTFGSGLIYPVYQSPLHRDPLSVVADQQIGGAALWVLALPPLFMVGVALLIRWLNDEERAEVSRDLDRMFKPPRQVWPSRPGLR